MASPLFEAIRTEDLDTFRERIRRGDNVNEELELYDTPSLLFYAVFHQTEKKATMAKELIDAGADVDVVNLVNETPLYVAAIYNNDRFLADYLLEKGADPDISPEDGETPLFVAARRNNNSLVDHLLEKGADPNIIREDGESPLTLAFSMRNKNMIDALIRRDASQGWAKNIKSEFRTSYDVVKHVVEGILARGNSIHEDDFKELIDSSVNRVDMMVIIRIIAQKDRSATGDRARDLLFKNRFLIMGAIHRMRKQDLAKRREEETKEPQPSRKRQRAGAEVDAGAPARKRQRVEVESETIEEEEMTKTYDLVELFDDLHNRGAAGKQAFRNIVSYLG